MAKKAGRPPGSQNKVGKEQKEFIKGLLGETQEEFRNAFLFYAKQSDKNAEDRSKFVNLSIELSKMVVPKPLEIDATMEVSDFEILLGQCTKWDDEE
jgi:hypothetical protein